MSERLRIVVRGRVQGVGFRVAAYRKAIDLGLRGWVRNMPDGRVEMEVQGAPDRIRDMQVWCHNGPALARVDEVLTFPGDTGNAYAAFEIRS